MIQTVQTFDPPVGQTMTVAPPPSSNCIDFGQYQQPTYQYWFPYNQTIEVEPKTCMGKAHVFACDHVKTCDCGAVVRDLKASKKARAK